MNATWTHRDDSVVIGLLTGVCVGTGLAIWLAPRLASVLRQRVFDSARSLGRRAAEQYQHVGTHVGEAGEELVRREQGGRDDVADAGACPGSDPPIRETPAACATRRFVIRYDQIGRISET
jgi:hypothetical protein